MVKRADQGFMLDQHELSVMVCFERTQVLKRDLKNEDRRKWRLYRM